MIWAHLLAIVPDLQVWILNLGSKGLSSLLKILSTSPKPELFCSVRCQPMEFESESTAARPSQKSQGG